MKCPFQGQYIERYVDGFIHGQFHFLIRNICFDIKFGTQSPTFCSFLQLNDFPKRMKQRCNVLPKSTKPPKNK